MEKDRVVGSAGVAGQEAAGAQVEVAGQGPVVLGPEVRKELHQENG